MEGKRGVEKYAKNMLTLPLKKVWDRLTEGNVYVNHTSLKQQQRCKFASQSNRV